LTLFVYFIVSLLLKGGVLLMFCVEVENIDCLMIKNIYFVS